MIFIIHTSSKVLNMQYIYLCKISVITIKCFLEIIYFNFHLELRYRQDICFYLLFAVWNIFPLPRVKPPYEWFSAERNLCFHLLKTIEIELGIASISLAVDWLLASASDQPETVFFFFFLTLLMLLLRQRLTRWAWENIWAVNEENFKVEWRNEAPILLW